MEEKKEREGENHLSDHIVVGDEAEYLVLY